MLPRSGAQISALDAALQRRVVERRSGGVFGVRVARTLTSRFAAEFTLDYDTGALALTDETSSSLEATRSGFAALWNAGLRSGLFTSRTIGADITRLDRGARELVTAGALLVNLPASSRLTPYVAAGAGYASTRGTPPSVALTGTYEITVAFPGIPVSALRQTDALAISSTIDNGNLWVLGGGVKYALSSRWGVRFDVRDYLRRVTATTVIATAPATPPSTFGSLTLLTFPGTTPPVVFSGTPGSSTLSVPLSGFETFRGSGVEHRVHATGGVVLRF
jgi:opacity protein-like surface antigen